MKEANTSAHDTPGGIERRQHLLRWSLRFLAANIAIAILLALRYFQFYSWPSNPWVLGYVPMMLVSPRRFNSRMKWRVEFS